PDLVILDLGLPDRSGFEVIAEIRKHSPVPIIVLSARSDERSKVEALDLGADDYIGKPFGMAELMARLRAALRHAFQAQGELPVFVSGDLSVDLVRRHVTHGGREIKLSPKEFELLRHLVAHAGKVLTHRQLLREGRGRRYAAETAEASAGAARMRTDAAMHRDPGHRLVGPVAGEIAGDVFDHSLREQPHRSESAAAKHHLVEGSHCPRRAEPA